MVVNMNPATLDEAIRAAGEVEADLTIRKSLLLANKDPPTRVHAIASEEKVEAPRLCFKCKQPGHFARACPSGPSGPRDQQRPRYCNYCKREGHVYARCWKREQAENLNSKPSHATDAGVTLTMPDDASTTRQSWQLPQQDKTTPQSYQSDAQN
uniref:CCHC-type domain-containing protein n=1 Tax=Trichogramma kaykai TaxID=54128 RepID=A0ABD2VU02_9HYME